MCAASSEQLSVRYGTKAHMNQKNRQISNIEKPGRDNGTKPLPVGLMEILHCVWLKGVIWVVSDCLVSFFFFFKKKRACDASCSVFLPPISVDLLRHKLNQWEKARWQASEVMTQRKGRSLVCVCVFGCVWEGTSGWAHRSAVSSYLLCQTDGSVSEPQTRLLQQETHENRANYSTQSKVRTVTKILYGGFMVQWHAITSVYLWQVGRSAGQWGWSINITDTKNTISIHFDLMWRECVSYSSSSKNMGSNSFFICMK